MFKVGDIFFQPHPLYIDLGIKARVDFIDDETITYTYVTDGKEGDSCTHKRSEFDKFAKEANLQKTNEPTKQKEESNG